MNMAPLRMAALTMICALTLAGISCNRGKAPGKAMPPEHVKAAEAYKKSVEEAKKITVAKVNGVSISMRDLIDEMNVIAPQFIKPGQKKDQDTDEKVRKEALDRLIYRELAVQAAQRQGLKVPPERIADSLKKIRANLKTENAYKEKLDKSGITEEDLKKQLERNMLVEMITEKEIFGKVTIDPKQVEKVYAKEKASYKGPSGKQMSLEEARPLIEEKLMRPAVNKREDEWVEQMQKAAKIEITLDKSAKEIHAVR